MSSQTKETILQRHHENLLLNSSAPSIMMRGTQDVSADEPLAPLDEHIIASTLDALEAGQTHYVDVPGIAPLREAVANFLNTTTACQHKTANILVTAGIQEARFLTLQMIGEQFGSIALPSVVHPGARKALGVRALHIVPIMTALDGILLPSLDIIRHTLESGSRLVYLESPSRLTGAAYSTAEVKQIADLLREHRAAAIWDQGLSAWTDPNYASLSAHADSSLQVAAIGEAWPGSGLASWLVGYIAAPEGWVSAMQSQKQIMAICTSTPSQYAALEASKLYAEAHPARLAHLSGLRAAIIERLHGTHFQAITGQAASVLALRLNTQDKETVSAKLRRAGFTFTDGSDFGAPDVLRFAVSPAALDALQLLTG